MKRIIISAISVLLICSCGHKAPVIAISCTLSGDDAKVSSRYFDAVLHAGGIPLAVPQTCDAGLLESIVRNSDGVILVGGEDVDPSYYGESPVAELGTVLHHRDSSDMALINTALKLRKPLLGICRGEQIINVALGGSLYQDLYSQYDTDISHRDDAEMAHAIVIDRTTDMGGFFGPDSVYVCTHHHQAVKRLADGLRIVATAPDGVVEAYESLPSLPSKIIGVQWHPETFTTSKNPDPNDMMIFDYFLSKL